MARKGRKTAIYQSQILGIRLYFNQGQILPPTCQLAPTRFLELPTVLPHLRPQEMQRREKRLTLCSCREIKLPWLCTMGWNFYWSFLKRHPILQKLMFLDETNQTFKMFKLSCPFFCRFMKWNWKPLSCLGILKPVKISWPKFKSQYLHIIRIKYWHDSGSGLLPTLHSHPLKHRHFTS